MNRLGLLLIFLGWAAAAPVVVAQIKLHESYGHAAKDGHGYAVAFAGDTDGDGHDDLLVGAPQNTWGPPATGPGYVEVRSGADGWILHSLAGAIDGDAFGSSVAGIGDVDLDGF